MGRSLGRTYPSDVRSTIANLGENLDNLMASGPELAAKADLDLSSQIATLNSRLVNEVIIASDQISDGEARTRLNAIKDDVFRLFVIFRQNGVAVQGRQAMPTTEGVATIPMAQAQRLLSDLKETYDLYPSIVDRYARVRPMAETAAELPVAGASISGTLAAVDGNMVALDQDVLFARDAIAEFEKILAASGDSVQIERSTFVRIQNWIGGVRAVDEALKRLEGIFERKPAEPGPSRPAGIPWWAVVLGGAAVVGVIAAIVTATERG